VQVFWIDVTISFTDFGRLALVIKKIGRLGNLSKTFLTSALEEASLLPKGHIQIHKLTETRVKKKEPNVFV
jgi:hypothetical protein